MERGLKKVMGNPSIPFLHCSICHKGEVNEISNIKPCFILEEFTKRVLFVLCN